MNVWWTDHRVPLGANCGTKERMSKDRELNHPRSLLRLSLIALISASSTFGSTIIMDGVPVTSSTSCTVSGVTVDCPYSNGLVSASAVNDFSLTGLGTSNGLVVGQFAIRGILTEESTYAVPL